MPDARTTRGLLRAIRFVCALLLFPLAARVAAQPPNTAPPADHAEQMAAGLDLFKSHVRETLIKNCLDCHGGKKVEGDLNLADRPILLQGGATGPAVVPGKSSESLLYKLIAHEDEPAMPYDLPRLPDEAIANVARWIDLGAPYDRPLIDKPGVAQGKAEVTDEDRQFWSFVPLRETAVPAAITGDTWSRTTIDRFIREKQQAAGLTPNPIVDRRKLIRRAYLDLLGLPPEPAAIDAFIVDSAPDAYERLIDRLLASPHYGERWGRHWLDLARWAESHGYEQDYDRPAAYHYRDFVIRALNDDLPYDRFVRWQIAGDELEPDNPLALMATGFLGAGTHATQITANQVEKERYDELDDMLHTVGTAMLGLTIGCARCHDHKFDPIPTRDYYRMLSTFTTTVRSEIELDLDPERTRQARETFAAEHAPLVEALARYEADELPAQLAKWLETNNTAPTPDWLIVEPTSLTSQAGATFTAQPDGSYLVAGTNGESDTYTFTIDAPFDSIAALRVEALPDASLPKSGPGRAENGNFALSSIVVTAAPLAASDQATSVELASAEATFEQKGLPVAAVIDADAKSSWAVDPEFGKPHAAIFRFKSPIAHQGGSRLTIELRFAGNTGHNIGRPRLSIATRDAAGIASATGSAKRIAEINRILATESSARSEADQKTLLTWYTTIDPQRQTLHQAVEAHQAKEPKPELTKVMVTSEGFKPIRFHTQGADFFEQTYILKRGDLGQKQDVADQGFLQALIRNNEGEAHWLRTRPEGARTSLRRTALADWITDTQEGAGALLARVIVNRLWQHHFGRGLVATPSDFGKQGEAPSHPELLEYLANELIAGGWRLKPLHRAMMTSAVYMQSLEIDEQRTAIDPNNILLWRRNRQRLEAETIRDCLLAASGALDRAMYGPGTLDANMRRRSIYFFIKRSQLIPLMTLFDAPEPLVGIASRSSTTIAPQGLALLNNEQLRSGAVELAKHVAKDGRSLPDSIRQAYIHIVGRPASDEELARVHAFVAAQAAAYEKLGQADATQSALADACQALFCTNEFIYIE